MNAKINKTALIITAKKTFIINKMNHRDVTVYVNLVLRLVEIFQN